MVKKICESQDIIPNVNPAILSLDELVIRGLVAESSGQIRLGI